MNNFSGDIAFRVLESVKNVSSRALQNDVSDDLEDKTQIYVCDINPNMLSVGKKRAIERGIVLSPEILSLRLHIKFMFIPRIEFSY